MVRDILWGLLNRLTAYATVNKGMAVAEYYDVVKDTNIKKRTIL